MRNESKINVSINDLIPIIENSIKSGGSIEITAPGNSMKPLFIDRQSRIRLAAAENIAKGDIVLYKRQNGQYVLHRIVKVKNDSFTMCGDHQITLENGIKTSQIIAKVTDFARKEKWISADSILYGVWWRIHILDLPLRRKIINFINR